MIPIDGFEHLRRSLRLLSGQRSALVADVGSLDVLLAVRGEPGLLDDALVALWLAEREHEARIAAAWPGAVVVRCGWVAGVREIATLLHLGRWLRRGSSREAGDRRPRRAAPEPRAASALSSALVARADHG